MEPSQLRARAAVGATGHSCMQPRRSAPRQSAKVPTALSITEVANPWTCAAASSLMAARIGGGSSSSRCRVDTSAALGDAITVSASPTHARLRNRPPQVKLDPETKAKHNRPPGWQAPGPQPVGAGSDPSLEPQENETLSYLTGDWRIFQLKNGHRWSMDDMMTAYVALQEAAAINQAAADGSGITHALDIGCGIGSVLMMVAWGLRRKHMEQQQQQQQQQQRQRQQQAAAAFSIRSVGVEAQAVSCQLARRSIRYNLGASSGLEAGVQVGNQDLRQPLPLGPVYQLVTGTPPYIPEGSGGRSDRPQKAPCCLEIRGGIEDYCAAAAAALAPGGVFVVCGGIQGQPARFKGRRAQLAAAAAGLVVVRQVTVVTREGKPPLFAVYVMKRAAEVLQDKNRWQAQQQRQQQQEQQLPASSAEPKQHSFEEQVASGQLYNCEQQFMVQYADGRHSQAWHEARAAMGLPPLRQ